MEHIRQALERATTDTATPANPGVQPGMSAHAVALGSIDADLGQIREIELRHKQLESERIVAHDNTDPRSKAFDMLRTQILQSMDMKEWQILAVTSPTAGCGKTFTAVNLALSIARQRERSVMLVDFDLQKPQISNRLNIRAEQGVLGYLEGHSTLSNSLVRVRVGNSRLTVLPCEKATLHSSEWMASNALASLLRELKQADKSRIIILDLPPMLTGDDVLSILPQVDCVLFVAAIGTTTIAEIKECNKHMQSTTVVRIALNKVSEAKPKYYY